MRIVQQTPPSEPEVINQALTVAPKEPPESGDSSSAPSAAVNQATTLNRGQEILQASVHGGYGTNPSYWRQLAKIIKALEYRHDQQYNLISPIIPDELKLIDKLVPQTTKNPVADIAAYREIAVAALVHIESGGHVINWRMTLAGVEPEKNIATRFARRAAKVGVYAVNPLAGAAVGVAGRSDGR
jgi:hypothetical protein